MNEERPRQFAGPLTPKKIAQGMNAASANSARLANDAKILLETGSYPSAFALAVLAIEESGKLTILRALSLARNAAEVREQWRFYRSHTSKNAMWPFVDMVKAGARQFSDFKSLFDSKSGHTRDLENLKQLSLYTDCLNRGTFSLPVDLIDEELARSFVSVAEILAKERHVTDREIELWVECVGPVWKSTMERMETGVIEWYRRMREEGLSYDDPEYVTKFLLGETVPKPGNGTP